LDRPSSVVDREAGYRDALAGHGLSGNATVVPICGMDLNWDYTKSVEVVQRTLDRMQGRCGVFLVHSGLIPHVWPAIEAGGFLHSDVGIACFDQVVPGWLPDDVLLVRALMPVESMARKAIEILMEKLAGSKQLRQLSLKPRVLIHEPTPGAGISAI